MPTSPISERLGSPRSSFLPATRLISPPQRLPSEYDLDELEPRPDDSLLRHEVPGQRTHMATRHSSTVSSDKWNERQGEPGSPSKFKSAFRPMFEGPPPPIAKSMMLPRDPRHRSTHSGEREPERSILEASRAHLGSVFFDQGPHADSTTRHADSVWRGLQRRERCLEADIQKLLDQQAAGLVAGSNGLSAGDSEDYSDTGSSTPTGTFYSTATSKSQMANSLYVPTRANKDGNVIPVRQPKTTRTSGLRSARVGLRRSIAAMAELKAEEDSYIDVTLSERRKALSDLKRLSTRKDNISTELSTIEQDQEEPLGQELRDLSGKYDELGEEIRLMEERLVGMRNRRRWIRNKMDDVRNRRESGLSGYRGALKNVDHEIKSLLHRPPVQPLDTDLLGVDPEGGPVDVDSPSGADFMRLIPERRTVDMAKSWWESEVSALEMRKSRIEADREALEEGSVVWRQVMSTVTDFEARLRAVVQHEPVPSSNGQEKGKEKAPSLEDIVRDQLPSIDAAINTLEKHMQHAEERHWNLLICATGAELEAFREAREMLAGLLADEEPSSDVEPPNTLGSSVISPARDADSGDPASLPIGNPVASPDAVSEGPEHEESDNDVPPDLLVTQSTESSPALRRSLTNSSNNDVPDDFLAEHETR